MLDTWEAVSTLDRMLDDRMGSTLCTARRSRTFQPAFDVRESDAELTLVCDVPGVRPEDLEVTLEKHILRVKGTRRFDGRENEQVMLGRAYGPFNRAFALPDSIDDANLTASVADGVLTIRIPKLAKARPRKIQIGSASAQKRLEE